MTAALFTGIGAVVTGSLTLVGNLFTGAVGLLYDGTAITDLGEIVLFVAAAPLVFGAVAWIISQVNGGIRKLFSRGKK